MCNVHFLLEVGDPFHIYRYMSNTNPYFFDLFCYQLKKLEMRILVTVPHAGCFVSKERVCDRRAFEAAKILATQLQKYGADVTLYANQEILRSQIDMNRFIARSTPWRKTLTRLL